MVAPSELSHCKSKTDSTASSFQSRNKAHNVINQCSKKKERVNFKKISNTLKIKKKLKDLNEDEMHSEVIFKIFKHQVDSTEALLMHIECNDMKGLNEESSMFKEGIKKMNWELKQAWEPDENEKSDNNQSDKNEYNLKSKRLDLNNQCNNIIKVAAST